MLLNPRVQGDQKLEGLSADPFDRPIPGQSLTSTPKAWPWEILLSLLMLMKLLCIS